MKTLGRIFTETFNRWMENDALLHGAALAYYCALSLAPLLVTLLAVTGMIYRVDAIEDYLLTQLQQLVGSTATEAISSILQDAERPGVGNTAAVVGALLLMIGATGVFAQLQQSLNVMWNVEPKSNVAVTQIIKVRLVALGLVIAIGFLLIVSLIVSTVIATLISYAEHWLPANSWLATTANVGVNFVVLTLLFGAIYKTLPDAKIVWHDVLTGAAVTAALFIVGQILISLYLGHSTAASSYGAAGSLVVILIWVYYSSQIFFIGAIFTQAWAEHRGSRIRPAKHAKWADTAKLQSVVASRSEKTSAT